MKNDSGKAASCCDAKAPAISVIMPVYNGARYLAAAVESILAQSFRDFELLVMDDGSADASLSILQRYRELDSRVRLYSRENRGLASTLNELVDLARGQWVARMDCDDISLPQRLERQLRWLEASGADICGAWARYFGSPDRRAVRHPVSDQAIRMALLFGSPFVHPTVVMRRTLARELRYDPAWEKAEDYDLWERAARMGCRMGNVPEILLLHRLHKGQSSASNAARQRFLTEKIQSRYGRFVTDSLKLDGESLAPIVKLRSTTAGIDQEKVDAAFRMLLERSEGEARRTVLDLATRLYYRMAAESRDCAKRWGMLNKNFGDGARPEVMIKLHLLRMFRITPGGRLFDRIKKLYFYLSAWGSARGSGAVTSDRCRRDGGTRSSNELRE